ncbi:acyl-CoA dehydrogenase family member 11-like [Actinia tenebrosa]|uniref:Acyl-CoA dehydrogenase family member 11 n=1 Tax=Actinia tenebrosa TaxID=6105 RepID=A0A6P8IRI6_ACTTE|nr:acyl-CoA dehydrogenase family member 11-like [Actinia tenebrosa]
MEDQVGEVRKEHQFDKTKLHRYLNQNLLGFPKGDGELLIYQYRSGQSNPTFKLNKNGCLFVLRKKPPGRLLKGAHMVDREFRVMSALFQASFPVPKPLLYCSDTSVIGTEFYIMEHVQGRIFRNPSLPAASIHERHQIHNAMISTLAHLHSINWERIGLSDFGHHSKYLQRQTSTWSKQYDASATANIPSMEKLKNWLHSNIPQDTFKTVIVHGDFRLDNIIFHPTKFEVIAVLDWELATLGHPVSDLAYTCLPYHWPKQMPFQEMSLNGVTGIPSEADCISMYSNNAGLIITKDVWTFCLALNFFKYASIAQGVYKRSLQGNASAPNASIFGKVVEPLSKASFKIIEDNRSTDADDLQIPPEFNMLHISSKARHMYVKMKKFIDDYILPAEKIFLEHSSNLSTQWTIHPYLEELKEKAQKLGLWNLFLPAQSGLSQLDYALLAELSGRSPYAPEVFNCSAPDTGNMEVLHLYGSPEQKTMWLEPLLQGKIRSAFCMTEPGVASSDATNMECEIRKEGKYYVINGRKWWSSGAGDPRCKIAIVMGGSRDKDLPRHRRHSMVLVPLDTPGVTKIRPLQIFGYNDAPHGHLEIVFDNVRVPASNMILGEGRGFEIAQGRLGPGRLHHCMRSIGLAERALELLCERALDRVAFGKRLAEKGIVQEQISLSRMEIDQARLLVLKAAYMLDTMGNKAARKEIAMAKVVVARMACRVIDRAIQVHGGKGVSQDSPLPYFYALARSLRIADGPDEVHMEAVAKMELKQHLKSRM